MTRDDERDPHLREALRHAPDAQLQPPPALSARILQEARAKARDPQPVAGAPMPGPLAALWAWLARPAVATGFAGVMAATLVGLMWWDQPMGEAMPRSPVPATAPVAAEASAEAPPASAPGAAAPTGNAAGQAKELAAAGPAEPAAAKPVRTAPPAKKSADAEEARQAERKRAGSDTSARLAPPAEGRTTAARPVERQVEQQIERAAAMADRAAPADTRAAPLRESATPPPALAAAPTAPPLPAAAPSPAPAGAGVASPHATFGAIPAAPQRLRAKAELNETRARLEAEAFTGIASLRAEVATDPAQWQWQRGNGAPQAMNDAVYAWLAQLDTATARRWEPMQANSASGAPLTQALQLWRDGRLQHSVWLTEREVLWQRGQTSWRVALAPEPLAALRAALDGAAP